MLAPYQSNTNLHLHACPSLSCRKGLRVQRCQKQMWSCNAKNATSIPVFPRKWGVFSVSYHTNSYCTPLCTPPALGSCDACSLIINHVHSSLLERNRYRHNTHTHTNTNTYALSYLSHKHKHRCFVW
jgi:hypothetical protein